jgi:hypothetical protein
MVLLSQMMRSAAFTGRTDNTVFARVVGRQGGRWAQQTVQAAYPAARPAPPPDADPAATLRRLTDLRDQGVITDAELQALAARVQR